MSRRHIYWMVLCLMIVLPLGGIKAAAADKYPNRLSLAISGGASKGAYEAGLIWGVMEVVSHLEKTGDWSLGGEPVPIEIAGIAGTSAGGINTVLAAMTWAVKPEEEGGFANRIDDNIFRDIWLTPDVNRLLPPKADSPLYLPDDALLSRKDLAEVAGELQKKWRRPGTFRPGIRLPMGVTVTRVNPETMTVSDVAVENQRLYIPFEMRTRPDGGASFFFEPKDYPSLNDPAMILMPWPADSEPFSISDQQVIDALLTTSAFPAGFGRKRLQYCRQKMITTDEDSAEESPDKADAVDPSKPVCPDEYELAEAEFADGGLFDNLPIGLARRLSESSIAYRTQPAPIRYIYLDPDRIRYETVEPEDKPACEGENPPQACRKMTFNLASELEVLGGAVGTARRYELYRELTTDTWRLNLVQLSRKVAELIDASNGTVACESMFPWFEGQTGCSDRVRTAGRLLELGQTYRYTPIEAPFSVNGLMQAQLVTDCRPPQTGPDLGFTAECKVDTAGLRKQLAQALADLVEKAAPEDEILRKDIRRSALSINADRSIVVTNRGAPITGQLLGAFGAFIEYKFREYDYYVGVYDAIAMITDYQCGRYFPLQAQQDRFETCRDRLSEQLFHFLEVADNPKGRYVYALMARQEFGAVGGLRYAYEPMPPADRDFRIIHEGLNKSYLTNSLYPGDSKALLSTERDFFEHLRAEGFQPTPPPGGETALLTLIMADPEYWSHELVKRTTNRLILLEQQADRIYRAREPDPEKRESADTTLMGAGALVLRTATYQYPSFAWSPSTAPQGWFWQNLIPYEAAFDFVEGDILVFWQPTLSFKHNNVGIRAGVGFAGGIFNSISGDERENYGTLGLDLTRKTSAWIFSGWGITPAVYHNWEKPSDADQTTFGLDLHSYLLKDRIRISLGARDIVDQAGNTLFLTIGIADLPGLIYWLSR